VAVVDLATLVAADHSPEQQLPKYTTVHLAQEGRAAELMKAEPEAAEKMARCWFIPINNLGRYNEKSIITLQ
jgi:hypothetical protein